MTAPAYRLLDVGAARLAVTSPIASFHAHLDLVYPYHPPLADSGFADVRVALLPEPRWRWRPSGRQAILWADGLSPFEPYPRDQALPLFEWGSNFLLSQRLNAYLLLHAGVLARDDRALLLPAAPGSGKTTLSCALHLAGWRFLSDEFGIIDMERGELLPMVRPAPLKSRSIELIGRRPGARLGPLFAGTRKGDVAHFVPDRDSFDARHRRAQPALIVFPRYSPGAALQCLPLASSMAALRIGQNSFNYQALGPSGFAAVVALTRRVRAYELVFDDIDDAMRQIELLFEAVS